MESYFKGRKKGRYFQNLARVEGERFKELKKEKAFLKSFDEADLKFLAYKGVIKGDLGDEDLKVLEILGRIWCKVPFLKRQLSRFSYKKRFEIFFVSSFKEDRLTAYLISRIRKARENGERLKTEQVVNEVINFFRMSNDEGTREFIRKRYKVLRKKVFLMLRHEGKLLKKEKKF